jgi:hypothetical protein
MKLYFISCVICFLFGVSCKSKEKAVAPVSTSIQVAETPKTTGKVSHQFRPGGCATVIIVDTGNPNNPLILIPKSSLNEFDKDGLEISFTYRKLRMPNPPGCIKGSPVDISDITKK